MYKSCERLFCKSKFFKPNRYFKFSQERNYVYTTCTNHFLISLKISAKTYSLSFGKGLDGKLNATILHLNVAPHVLSHLLEVTLQINKKEVSTIIATFERYEYSVTFYSGEELFENEISTNYNHLMNYLSI